MKALILNSGMGKRMGKLTSTLPKCMVELIGEETILSRQLKLLKKAGINEIVMTTGPYHLLQQEYITQMGLDMKVMLVNNEKYAETNYIYSIFLARDYLDDDILLLHGDLVFEEKALEKLLQSPASSMAVSFSIPLPQKDFKAVIKEKKIIAVGIEFFESAVAAQPMYRLKKEDWRIWLDRINIFCESGQTQCYAENALNEIADIIGLYPIDMANMLCQEVDKEEDLLEVQNRLKELQ